MRICCASSGFSSMLILTKRTAPRASRTAFSSIGPSCLQGPHQGAQKSTTTAASWEASITSAMKVAVELVLIRSAPSAALGALPSIGSIAQNPLNLPLRWRPQGRLTSSSGRASIGAALEPRHRYDLRLMARCGDEFEKIGGTDRGRRGIYERGGVERVDLEHLGVEHDAHAPLGIIDERKRSDDAGGRAESALMQSPAAAG